MSLLSLFVRKRGATSAVARSDSAEIPVLDPAEGPVYVVGDTHGSLSLYRQMEVLILQDSAIWPGTPTVVLLGDMVDKGSETAALLDHMLRPAPPPLRRVLLRGNHESMMLEYLDAPAKDQMWLDVGGAETLASYGLAMDMDKLRRSRDRTMRHILAAHIPDSHLTLLHGTLPGLLVGRYLLAHAGADADAPLSAQPWDALLWGRSGLIAPDDLTLVHGHYITPRPEIGARSIGIDTGAYATGRLTCLRLVTGKPPAILTTREDTGFRELPATFAN